MSFGGQQRLISDLRGPGEVNYTRRTRKGFTLRRGQQHFLTRKIEAKTLVAIDFERMQLDGEWVERWILVAYMIR